jgi:hypothetical protein
MIIPWRYSDPCSRKSIIRQLILGGRAMGVRITLLPEMRSSLGDSLDSASKGHFKGFI